MIGRNQKRLNNINNINSKDEFNARMIVKVLQRMRSLPSKKSEFFIIQPPGRELYGDKRLVKSSQSCVSTYVSLSRLKVTAWWRSSLVWRG